jgi:hypothetical protein
MSYRHAALTIAAAVLSSHCASSGSSNAEPRAERQSASSTSYVVASTDSAAGAYLTIVGGCNDCHTPSWAESNGRTPDADRLTGSIIGYRGPWGTTYAANLRILPPRMSEDRWVQVLTTADSGHGRPPMPWMTTALMSQRDLRNMYRYVKALGPKGQRMPRAVPPGTEPSTLYIPMVPQKPESSATKQGP